jgi:O-succinylbenzoate synthase
VRIERAVLREVPLELRESFDTSHGRVRRRRVLLLSVHAQGLEGWAECVAGETPSYTAETTETAWHVLTEFVLPAVVGYATEDGGGPAGGGAPAPDRLAARVGRALDSVRWIRGHPMALASVEMAIWDLLARAERVPLAAALGGSKERVPVGISLGLAPTLDALLDRVARALDEGYARIKLKIEPGRDVDLLAEVRARYAEATLSVDANGAYTLADAPRLQALDPLALQMLEQPLACDDLVDHARLQERLTTPICLDEGIASEADVATALELGSCRVVNLKPGRVGGLAPARRIHDAMRSASMPVWCGGMLETGIGRAHNLALASLPGFTLPGDISASRRYWERDIVFPEHVVEGGWMAVPTGVGIGVEVDVERIEAATVRVATFG